MNIIALELFDLFWSMLWFFLFLMWIALFVTLITDIFRSTDLSGPSKALWVIALIVMPFLGSLVYLIVRGDGMASREIASAKERESAFRALVQDAAGSGAPSTADEVTKLADLHARGVIDDEEFARQKAKALA